MNEQADSNDQPSLLEKLILSELAGKNNAIHAYDGIMWKIRTGFLTLLFGGWATLLKAGVESTKGLGVYQSLAWGLFLFTLAFSYCAWSVDRSYMHRKFRVINALGHLTDAIITCGTDHHKIPAELLKVAGDSGDMPFDSKGYREAARVELSVYFIPLFVLAVVIALVVH